MIVRDEEDNLPRCLDSVKDIVDEIIIVDTGSEDRTVEIAESYGAKIYHHPWEGSFSGSRNHSLEYATGKWILILDADETIPREEHSKIRALLENSTHDGYYFLNLQLSDSAGAVAAQHYNLRLFKNGLGVRYEGRVHNQPNLDEDRISCTDIRLLHYGYVKGYAKKQQKYERSAALLKRELQLDPEAHHYRFHLGSLYHLMGKHDEAREHLLIAAEKNENLKYRAKSYLILGYMCFQDNDLEEAIPYCDRAVEVVPGYCIARFLRAEAMRLLGNPGEAARAFRDIIRTPVQPLDPYYDLKENREIRELSAPWRLNLCHWDLGEKEEGLEGLRRLTSKTTAKVWQVCLDLGMLLFNDGRNKEAARWFHETLARQPGSFNAHLHLGLIHLSQGDETAGEREILQALELAPEEPSVLLNTAGLRAHQNNHEEAAALLDRLLEQFPDNTDALYNKALSLEKLGRVQECEECYRRLSRIMPDNLVLFDRWAGFCQRSGRFERVPHLLGRALRLDGSRFDLRLRRARALLELSRLRNSLRYLKEASAEVARILESGSEESAAAAQLLEEIRHQAVSSPDPSK